MFIDSVYKWSGCLSDMSKILGLLLMIAVVRGEGLLRNPCVDGKSVCTDCDKITTCKLSSNGIDYEPGTISTCDANYRCIDGECVSGEACPATTLKPTFAVPAPGVYPHPFKCELFLVADDDSSKPKEALEHKCQANFYLNSTTMRCQNTDKAMCKPDTTALCTPEGGNHPLRDFPRLYYTCLYDGAATNPEIKVTIKECPEGRIFMGHTSNTCVSRAQAFLENGKCYGAGRYYVPDCTKYNECAGAGKTPALRSCPVGSRFNYFYQRCVPYSCN